MNKNSFLRKIRSVAVTVIALAAPAVFAEDAYIESDGTQFINTGYYVKPTTKLVLDYAIANWEASGSYYQMRFMDNNANNSGGGLQATVYIGGSTADNHSFAMALGDQAAGSASAQDMQTANP